VVQRRVVMSTMLLVLVAALTILVIRFYPGWWRNLYRTAT